MSGFLIRSVVICLVIILSPYIGRIYFLKRLLKIKNYSLIEENPFKSFSILIERIKDIKCFKYIIEEENKIAFLYCQSIFNLGVNVVIKYEDDKISISTYTSIFNLIKYNSITTRKIYNDIISKIK